MEHGLASMGLSEAYLDSVLYWPTPPHQRADATEIPDRRVWFVLGSEADEGNLGMLKVGQWIMHSTTRRLALTPGAPETLTKFVVTLFVGKGDILVFTDNQRLMGKAAGSTPIKHDDDLHE